MLSPTSKLLAMRLSCTINLYRRLLQNMRWKLSIATQGRLVVFLFYRNQYQPQSLKDTVVCHVKSTDSCFNQTSMPTLIQEQFYLQGSNCSRKYDYINWMLFAKPLKKYFVCTYEFIMVVSIAPNCSLSLQSVVRININH